MRSHLRQQQSELSTVTSATKDFETSRRFWLNADENFERGLGNPDVLHANSFYCPRGLRNARLVYTLYDLSFILEPLWTTEENRAGCVQGVFRASVNADFFLAISNFTKRHFLSTFPHVALADRIAVIYPASRFYATKRRCASRAFSRPPAARLLADSRNLRTPEKLP